MAIERHLQGMRTLNDNRHLARSITFEAVICENLLYNNDQINNNQPNDYNHRVITPIQKS